MPTGLEEGAAIAGLIGLSFQCLQGCLYGFKLFNTALNVGKESAFIRCALILEEYRLLYWAKSSGLANGRLNNNLDPSVVKETVAELQIILTNTELLQKRYKLDIKFMPPESAGPHSEEYHSISDQNFGFLENAALQRERANITARSKTIQKDVPALKKFWFAAVDKDKFANLIAEISKLIDGLESLLNAVERDTTRQALKSIRLQSIAAANDIKDIKSLLEALIMGAHGEEDLAEFKQFKAFTESASREESTQKEFERLLRQKPGSATNYLEDLSGSKLKEKPAVPTNPNTSVVQTYDGLTVYVEWKKYGWAARSKESLKKAVASIETLALLLGANKSRDFHTLRCKGLLEDARSESYRLIYYWPAESSGSETSASLRKHLSSPSLPSLSDRISVARKMANSLLLLQASNWLHKAICSRNVLFFPIEGASPLSNPYVVGFEYSRPDLEDEPSQLPDDPEVRLYSHPAYLQGEKHAFDKVFDIYAFGLVLIELAHWRPLKHIYLEVMRRDYLKQHEGKRKERNFWDSEEGKMAQQQFFESCDHSNLLALRKYLLAQLTPERNEIAFRTGEKYTQAVRFCLSEELDGFIGKRSLDEVKALQGGLFENVVRPLSALVV